MAPELKDQLASILGRIPSGVFILVAGDGAGRRTGMLASWIQQASFDPPQVTVAVNKSRYLAEWLTLDAPVTLNQVSKGDTTLFRHFGKGFDPDANAFEGVSTLDGQCGLPLLTAAMTSMEGAVAGRMDAGDHVIVLITLTAATAHRDPSEFDPFVHIRKNGFSY